MATKNAHARYVVLKTDLLDPQARWQVVDRETGRTVQYARLRKDALAWVRMREELHAHARATVLHYARAAGMFARDPEEF